MCYDAVMKKRLILIAAVLATGCFGGFEPRTESCPDIEALEDTPSMLAIGDSTFAWKNQTCRTAPDVAALELGRRVEHRAVNGARVTGGEYEIQDQYDGGDWDWVIFTGGGNDLNSECQCGVNCDRTLTGLVSPAGLAGQIPELIDRIRADGAEVILYGYYEIGQKAHYGFGECVEEIDELRERQRDLARVNEGVYFVDGREAVTMERTPEAYTFDDLHPSPKGARLVGELIAAEIRRVESARE